MIGPCENWLLPGEEGNQCKQLAGEQVIGEEWRHHDGDISPFLLVVNPEEIPHSLYFPNNIFLMFQPAMLATD